MAPRSPAAKARPFSETGLELARPGTVLFSLLCLSLASGSSVPTGQARHARLTFQECTTNKKTSFDMVLTEGTVPQTDAKDLVAILTVEAKGGGKSTITITKDSNGWPTNFQAKGDDGDPDPLTSMIFLMREPLWDTKIGTDHWKASTFSPFESNPKISVACQLSPLPNGAKGICLEEKTATFPLLSGTDVQFTSKFILDSVHGRPKTTEVTVNLSQAGKIGQIMLFEEKD
jgi:hypothetical protein